MTQEAAPATQLENLYLKFFKYVIVSVMTVALLAVIVLLPMAAYNYLQTPAAPTPAREPPARSITIDDLKKFLIEEEKRRLEQEKNGVAPTRQPVSAAPVTQRYSEDAMALYRCSEVFARLAEQDMDRTSEAELALRREAQRANIERQSDQPFRGPAWVQAMVQFTCAVLKDAEIAKLKKDKMVGAVLNPTMAFHGRTWSMLEKEKFEFRQAEANRVDAERNAESVRVALAKTKAVFMFGTAGALLGFFMLLALYLIFAKIENNLRLIHEGIDLHNRPIVAG